MSKTIADVFDLPGAEDIRAMGFVVRLRELEPDSGEGRRLVDEYVVTPTVEKELPLILDKMHAHHQRTEEYGRTNAGRGRPSSSRRLTNVR